MNPHVKTVDQILTVSVASPLTIQPWQETRHQTTRYPATLTHPSPENHRLTETYPVTLPELQWTDSSSNIAQAIEQASRTSQRYLHPFTPPED